MSEPVAAVLVGTGAWGRRLADAAARTPELDVAVLWSPDRERRAQAAAELGVPAAASLADALEHPGVEAALLASPNDVHAEGALAAAGRGVHVFVEKPVAHTVAAGEAMRDACERAGVVLAVGHEMRRLGASRRAGRAIAEGALGRPVLAEANWSLAGTLTPAAWRWYRRRAPGGPLLQLGIHHADTLAAWLGPVARSSGRFARLVTPAEIDDVGVATLEFEGGALGTITGSYVSPRTYSIRVLGTDGVLELRSDMRVWPRAERLDGATTLTLDRGDGPEPLAFDPVDPLADELAEFARAVRGDGRPETGAREGLAALAVILDAVGPA